MMCISHISTSLGRFIKYESQERPSVNKNHKISFPTVTLCSNSMHSKEKLSKYESGMSHTV